MAEDIEQRVRQATGGATGELTLVQRVEKMTPLFQQALPAGMEARILVRDIMTCLRATPRLAQCPPMSVLGAAMTCAQLGLRPGTPLQEAWLIPYWDSRSRGYQAQCVLGYQGLTTLAYRSRLVRSVTARIVHEADVFELDYGADQPLIHRPARSGDPGLAVGYYAIARTADGEPLVEYMSRWQAEQHRDRFASTRDREKKIYGPWVDHFDAMARKTPLRKLCKSLPQSADLALALAADEAVRVLSHDDTNPLDPVLFTPAIEATEESDDTPPDTA